MTVESGTQGVVEETPGSGGPTTGDATGATGAPRRRAWAWVAGVASVALIAGGVWFWNAMQTGRMFATAPTPDVTFNADDDDTFTGEGGLSELPDGEWVAVPALDISVPLVPVGTNNGIMEIPPSPNAGWYEGSPKPGAEEGSTLISAHVDFPDRSLTPFGRLHMVEKGTPVFVKYADGVIHEYRVSAMDTHPHDELPSSIFNQAGDHFLTLVTCSGSTAWTEGQWNFEHNLVVTADYVGTVDTADGIDGDLSDTEFNLDDHQGGDGASA